MKLFRLEVFTPYRLFYSGDVEAITLMLTDGEVGIYAMHSRFTAPVKTCVLRLRELPKPEDAQDSIKHDAAHEPPKRPDAISRGKPSAEHWLSAFITNGIIEVKRHKVVLLCDAAEWPHEIDRERALTAAKDAGETLAESSFKFEHAAAREKLIRASTRLKVLEIEPTAP